MGCWRLRADPALSLSGSLGHAQQEGSVPVAVGQFVGSRCPPACGRWPFREKRKSESQSFWEMLGLKFLFPYGCLPQLSSGSHCRVLTTMCHLRNPLGHIKMMTVLFYGSSSSLYLLLLTHDLIEDNCNHKIVSMLKMCRNWVWWHRPVILLGRWRQEDEKFQVIPSYKLNLRPSWALWALTEKTSKERITQNLHIE